MVMLFSEQWHILFWEKLLINQCTSRSCMRMGCKVSYEMICVMKPFPSFSSFNPHHIVLFCDKTVTFSLKAISSLNVSRKRLDYYLHKVKAGDIEALSKKKKKFFCVFQCCYDQSCCYECNYHEHVGLQTPLMLLSPSTVNNTKNAYRWLWPF